MLHTLSSQQTEQRVFGSLAVWAIAIVIAGTLGIFTHLPLPSIALLVVVSLTTLLVLYYRNAAVNHYVASLNPRILIAFHLWRIVAGFTFLYYGSQSLLPRQFVINAGYGDLMVGFLVPFVLLGAQSTQRYITFHLFGLLDFVVAVGTGLAFTLLQVPLMENIATFPVVLIPLFGVPLTGASSVMAIDTLLRQHREHANS
ncbi:MAG: hypothetical protein AAF329_27610 [Cyanobacteria bacterium P01_A01_bin.17]